MRFFYLKTTDDSLSATICKCDTSNNLGSNVCNKLGNNLQERLEFVKAKLEAPTKAAPASGLRTLAISSPNAHICTYKYFISLIILFSDCFSEVGFDYAGYDVEYSPSQTTVDDCRQYCLENCETCNFYTHVNDGGCWCKTRSSGRKPHALGTAITSGDICDRQGEWLIHN